MAEAIRSARRSPDTRQPFLVLIVEEVLYSEQCLQMNSPAKSTNDRNLTSNLAILGGRCHRHIWARPDFPDLADKVRDEKTGEFCALWL